MTALTASYEVERQDGIIVDVPVLAGATIYKGALVVDKGTGYASAGTDGSGYVFLGVAVESATGGSADGTHTVRVNKTGMYKYTMSGGATQTNLGIRVYIKDDNTVASSSTNTVACGYIAKYVDSTYVKVRIDRDVA